MKVTVIPIVISAQCTVTEDLIKRLENIEIRGRVDTIQTNGLLGSARILRRVLETCHSNCGERPSAKADMKNFQRTK